MLLVVGLGNPGKDYANNRHNIGFVAVNRIVSQYSLSSFRSKFQGEVADGTVGNNRVLALKPLTFMNESGRSVAAAMNFYKILPKNIIVIHDDIDLVQGKVRVKVGGGHAGHNGLRSIHDQVGSDFLRVRIGVGHPGDKVKVAGYVLRDFANSEQDLIDAVIDAVGEYIPILFDGDHSMFMSKVAAMSSSSLSKAPRPGLPHRGGNKVEKKSD